jgi:predicted RNA-binding protein with PUA-like domain
MAYWLFKSDPETYGFQDLERDKQAVWDGVSNPLALKHLRACKKGDQVFIYHSGKDKALVGLAEITREAYPDPKQKDERLVVVEIKTIKRLKKNVTLAEVKAVNEFSDFLLVRMPRLSVMPVTELQWKNLLKMADFTAEAQRPQRKT